MVYSALPLNAGFFFAVDDLGAKVPAILAAFFLSSLSTSTSLVRTPAPVPCAPTSSSFDDARTRTRRRAPPVSDAARMREDDLIRCVRVARGAHRIETPFTARVAIASSAVTGETSSGDKTRDRDRASRFSRCPASSASVVPRSIRIR